MKNSTDKIAKEMSKNTSAVNKLQKTTNGLTVKFGKLEKTTDNLTLKVDKLEKTTDNLTLKIDKLENTTNKIAAVVVEHGEKMKDFVTRKEFNTKMDQVFEGQDKIISIVTRLDQERIFSVERMDRLENKVEEHHKEISKIKEVVHIP